MANPSCIVETGKLSPVGQRNLSLFQGQTEKRMLVVVMGEAHLKAGYYGPAPSASELTAWMLPFLAAGIPVSTSIGALRSDTKAVIVLSANDWATRRDVGRYKDNVYQVWGEGGEAKSWPVMFSEALAAPR
jgi:hypothetical protein